MEPPPLPPWGSTHVHKDPLSSSSIFFQSPPQRCEAVGGKHKVGRPGLEPGTTGLKVHWELNGHGTFQHPPSPILTRLEDLEFPPSRRPQPSTHARSTSAQSAVPKNLTLNELAEPPTPGLWMAPIAGIVSKRATWTLIAIPGFARRVLALKSWRTQSATRFDGERVVGGPSNTVVHRQLHVRGVGTGR